MANLYEGLQTVDATLGAPPPAPPTPPGLYDGLEMAPTVAAPAAREPQGLLEYAEAGIHGSGLGLAFRGKLPDLVINPDTARWWERLATGVAGVVADLPIMIPAGAKGAALGAAVGGPVGAIVGGGSAMFAAPAGIRTSLMEVYKAQAGQTPYDWFNIVRETAKAMMHEGAVGAATFGAGAAARGGLAAVMGATSQAATAVGLGTATMATRGAARAAGAADVAAQIAAMVTFPAALEGRLPESREFLDAAAVILTLKGAHMALERTGALKTAAQRIANVYERTGKTPIEQVMDAKADPRIAGDLTADRAWEWPKGVSDQPTKQEELWSIQGRLMELDRRAAGGAEELRPLSDREALEREALRIKATALEAEGVVPDVPRGTEPRFAEEQLIEAKAIADRRIAELATKEAAAPLTDIERAERIGLVNTMNNPEALAKRFGIEPAIKPITDADRDASADRVYADVLRQAREADASRQAAGLDPLGDEHAQQVAAIVRARMRTRAARLGVLPEDLYNERPLQIRDETQAEIVAAAEAIPPEAPRFVPPPEVDLFGEPVLPTNAPRVAGEAIPTVAVPLSSLKLSTDVPQFKAGANARGVVQPLQGEVDLRGVAPIAVWERLNGDLEVISGRHRLDLWARKGKETIDAQIFREADGFDIKQAAMLDAEMNIRDEHGSVSDYANYFKNSGISESEAKSRGLLGRAKGQAGFRIAMDASPDLLAAHRAGLLSDDAALVLSGTAPGSERLQALGMAMINDGKSTLFAANMMRTVDLMAAERLAAGAQGDIFGFDDSAMREAAAMAKKASSAQRKISERVSAISGASRRPEIARQEGVDVRDPEAIQKRIAELKQEQYQWDNWSLYPELVAKLRAAGDLKQDALYQTGTLAPSARDWRDAPLDDTKYITRDEYYKALNPYVKDGVVTANSRLVPNDNAFPPLGSWRIDTMKLGYGREIEKLVELPIEKLVLGELASKGRLDPVKAGDEVRYAEWIKSGKRPPPIEVVQTEDGNLSVTDGHRRALAAKLAGATTVEAWVNFAVPVPEGLRYNRDPAGKLIRTGMTYEMLIGEVPNKFLDRLPLDPFELKPETPAELKARDEEAAAAAKRKLAQERLFARAAVEANDNLGFDTRNDGRTFQEAMREKIMAGQALFQNKPQDRGDQHLGSYSIADNLITTFRNANKSTIVHELSHSWLEEMKADAARPDAPAQIKADWEIIRREFAIGEDGNISTASHEQFARTGERYLGEGVAPSIGLRAVFERFKAWMLEIYDNLANLGVEINHEVRGLFDRLLATDQEIADAKALNVPVAYVPEARAAASERIVPAAPEGRKIEPGFEAEQASMIPYADELPKGPGEAPDSSHINYAYINSPMDVKLAMQRMAEIDQANIQKQRGGTAGVKSWEQANAEQAKYVNDILGGSEDTLRLLSPRDTNAAGPDVKLGILKKLAVGAAKDSARLRDVVLEAGHDATVRQQLEYMGSIERARMIQAEFLGERAGVARALNALKDVTEGTGEIGRMLDAIGYGEAAAMELFQAARTPAEEQAFLRTKLDEILLNYKGKSVLDIAKLHKEIGTLKGTFKFTKEVTKATKWEMVVEGWKAGILSGPVTHTTNTMGTLSFDSMRAPIDALAAVIGIARGASPGMGESDRASMSEALARITGMFGGVQDGIKAAVATFKLDDPTGKTEAYRTAIPGRAGEIIRIPLRMMGAEDALVSTMYTRGEIRTLAIRQAFDEGLNPATREFSERRQYLTDNPTPEMQAIADAAAVRMTFNMPLGEKGVALQSFVNKWNLQWVVPFIRTPINIVKEAARMTPFAPLVGEWRAAIAKGGVERDRALAEVALGSAIMAVTVALAFDGMVSGSAAGPDPGKNRGKVGVWQPGSVLIGDTWYEIARIEPIGSLMIAAADMAAVWEYMTDDEKDKVPKMVAVAFANSITNKTFLQGITNVINAMSEPGRFAPRFFQQLAGSMVPNVIGQPTAMADPYVREVNGMLEAIQARIPGLREQLLPRRDWLGAEMESKERVGVVMPVRKQQVSTDKVRLEAARLDISMAATPRKTHLGKGTGKIGDVEFTAEERNAFAKVGGEMAHDVLTNVVNDPGWDAMPDLVKRRVFAKVLQASHRVAAVSALPPEKRVAYITSISEQMAAELAPETQ